MSRIARIGVIALALYSLLATFLVLLWEDGRFFSFTRPLVALEPVVIVEGVMGPGDGLEITAQVPIGQAAFIQSDDTIDVYAVGSKLSGGEDFRLLARNVWVVPRGRPAADLLPGTAGTTADLTTLTQMAVTLFPTEEQYAVFSAQATGAQLALSWPDGLVPEEQFVFVDDDCPLEYSVAGQYMYLSQECGAAAPADPAQSLVDQLKAARLAFNTPETMMLDETQTVELVLTPEEVAALTALPAHAPVAERAEALGLSKGLAGQTRVETTQYAAKMQAELKGIDFDVSPEGLQVKTILPNQPTKWVWEIKAKAPGEQKSLFLGVDALLVQDGKDLPPVSVEVFRATMLVNVTLWQRAVLLAGEIKAVHAAIVAVFGSVFGMIGFLWKRRRKAKAEPEPKGPLEVVVTHKTG